MSQSIVTSAVIVLVSLGVLSLNACDKQAQNPLPDAPSVPMPESSGDAGIDAETKGITDNFGDKPIEIIPTAPKDDASIITPPAH